MRRSTRSYEAQHQILCGAAPDPMRRSCETQTTYDGAAPPIERPASALPSPRSSLTTSERMAAASVRLALMCFTLSVSVLPNVDRIRDRIRDYIRDRMF